MLRPDDSLCIVIASGKTNWEILYLQFFLVGFLEPLFCMFWLLLQISHAPNVLASFIFVTVNDDSIELR
jgi:hypothetical protein